MKERVPAMRWLATNARQNLPWLQVQSDFRRPRCAYQSRTPFNSECRQRCSYETKCSMECMRRLGRGKSLEARAFGLYAKMWATAVVQVAPGRRESLRHEGCGLSDSRTQAAPCGWHRTSALELKR
jgi:hypothetical protein